MHQLGIVSLLHQARYSPPPTRGAGYTGDAIPLLPVQGQTTGDTPFPSSHSRCMLHRRRHSTPPTRGARYTGVAIPILKLEVHATQETPFPSSHSRCMLLRSRDSPPPTREAGNTGVAIPLLPRERQATQETADFEPLIGQVRVHKNNIDSSSFIIYTHLRYITCIASIWPCQ